jgi:Beta-lactamase
MFGDLGPTTVLDRSPVEWGAGGLAAPARDALAFLSGLMAGKLLRSETLASMREFQATPALGADSESASPPDASDGYGLGLLRMERDGYTVVGHGGLFTGHSAGLWYLPECGVTVTLFFTPQMCRRAVT